MLHLLADVMQAEAAQLVKAGRLLHVVANDGLDAELGVDTSTCTTGQTNGSEALSILE